MKNLLFWNICVFNKMTELLFENTQSDEYDVPSKTGRGKS